MKVAGEYEVPDTCPTDCRFFGKSFDQGGICTRCPIFICKDFGDGLSPVVNPDDYRPDWAREWVRFFAGEVEYPELMLQVE